MQGKDNQILTLQKLMGVDKIHAEVRLSASEPPPPRRPALPPEHMLSSLCS